MSLTYLKDIAAFLVTIVALATFIKGLLEYSRDTAQRRLQILLELRKRFTNDTALQAVRAALESDNPNALRAVSRNHRVEFAAFFEEIAVMLNSKLISKHLALSMFGFYAIMANDSVDFWEGFDPVTNELYWRSFKEFAKEMKTLRESNPRYTPRAFRI